MDYLYYAEFVPDPDGGFLVRFPDIPEAITQGDDLRDARDSASDALSVALISCLADGRPLPVPAARGKGLVPIPVETSVALKLAVIQAFEASGLSKAELARRLGKPASEAFRILDPDHRTKVASLEDALDALGKHIVVSVHDHAA